MVDTPMLIKYIQNELRERQITYQELADKIGVS